MKPPTTWEGWGALVVILSGLGGSAWVVLRGIHLAAKGIESARRRIGLRRAQRGYKETIHKPAGSPFSARSGSRDGKPYTEEIDRCPFCNADIPRENQHDCFRIMPYPPQQIAKQGRADSPALEMMFDPGDPLYSALDRLDPVHPHQYRIGIRRREPPSVKRVRVRLVGVDARVAGAWHNGGTTIAAEMTTRTVFLREIHDAPPFQRSREGITIDPSADPTLFLLTSRHPGADRFDILHTLGNDNMPLNPDLPFRVRLEVVGENIEPIPVSVELDAPMVPADVAAAKLHELLGQSANVAGSTTNVYPWLSEARLTSGGSGKTWGPWTEIEGSIEHAGRLTAVRVHGLAYHPDDRYELQLSTLPERAEMNQAVMPIDTISTEKKRIALDLPLEVSVGTRVSGRLGSTGPLAVVGVEIEIVRRAAG